MGRGSGLRGRKITVSIFIGGDDADAINTDITASFYTFVAIAAVIVAETRQGGLGNQTKE